MAFLTKVSEARAEGDHFNMTYLTNDSNGDHLFIIYLTNVSEGGGVQLGNVHESLELT